MGGFRCDEGWLRGLLAAVGLTPDNKDPAIWSMRFDAVHAEVVVDLRAREISYPEGRGMHVNDRTTCNFEHEENFVVLECVCRLLAKGYRPEHLELEPRWRIGHDPSGGKADICVHDPSGDGVLCFIECKTAGREFRRERRDLEKDGGQLFSYWQQDRSARWLVLYASELSGTRIAYEAVSVDCSDDANLLLLARHDGDIRLYKDANTTEELHEAWVETYESAELGDVLFGDDTVAYEVGRKPLRKRDLVDFRAEDGIVNQFEEILRHNNVSDKENAFNRLIALFICKLVDEMEKSDEDEVEFQYRTGTDTFESLQDRLQRLHQKGMREFMHEDTFYVPENYVERTLGQYRGGRRSQLVAELNGTLRKLKYYTNNDFAFKDVHNEELFYQNGKVLVEVVRLFQPYRIIGSHDIQFLGDMFEQLLAKGFKQNEGQFFTPVPIARFMWDSLPVRDLVCHDGKLSYPRVVDYACGAGHFLTEGFAAVNDAVRSLGSEPDPGWAVGNLVGIEKDYRLARVSRISLFMHGAGGGSVIFGEGLDNYRDKGVVPGSFDVLVANPPYSVQGFKPHLSLKDNELAVADKVTDAGSEIETLFMERLHQLLRPGGVVAVVLPRTVLNKGGSSFVAARESLLQNFYLRAVVELGGKTFGATSISTVILFLEKFDEPPRRISMVNDSVDAILSGRELTDWEDQQIYDGYLDTAGVSDEDFRAFAGRARPWGDWAGPGHFGDYVEGFSSSGTLRSVERTARFASLDAREQDEERSSAFYRYALPIEREKLTYFALTYRQETLVVTSPTASADQERLLGYKWSNRKGSEGIQVTSPGGLLYDPGSREGSGRLCELVRGTFAGERADSPELAGLCSMVPTKDMFDYRTSNFTKELRLVGDPHRRIPLSKAYPMASLREVAPYADGRVRGSEVEASTYVTTETMGRDGSGVVPFVGLPKVDSAVAYRAGDVLVSNIRPYLRKIWLADRDGACSPDILVLRVSDPGRLLPEYLFAMLQDGAFFDYMMATARGMKMPRGDVKLIPDYQVPLPPPDVQARVASNLASVRSRLAESSEAAAALDAELEERFEDMFSATLESCDHRPLADCCASPDGIQCGPFGTQLHAGEYQDDGVPVWGIPEVNSGFDRAPSQFVSDERAAQLARFSIVPGDVAMSRKGNVGQAAVFREGLRDGIIHSDVIRVRCETGTLDPRFLVAYLRFSTKAQEGIQSVSSGMIMPGINVGKLKQVTIPVPPIGEQSRFAESFDQVEARRRELAKEAEALRAEADAVIRACY